MARRYAHVCGMRRWAGMAHPSPPSGLLTVCTACQHVGYLACGMEARLQGALPSGCIYARRLRCGPALSPHSPIVPQSPNLAADTGPWLPARARWPRWHRPAPHLLAHEARNTLRWVGAGGAGGGSRCAGGARGQRTCACFCVPNVRRSPQRVPAVPPNLVPRSWRRPQASAPRRSSASSATPAPERLSGETPATVAPPASGDAVGGAAAPRTEPYCAAAVLRDPQQNALRFV